MRCLCRKKTRRKFHVYSNFHVIRQTRKCLFSHTLSVTAFCAVSCTYCVVWGLVSGSTNCYERNEIKSTHFKNYGLAFEERGKPQNPEKNLSEQSKALPTSVTSPESNSGHIGGKRVESPLHHPCEMYWRPPRTETTSLNIGLPKLANPLNQKTVTANINMACVIAMITPNGPLGFTRTELISVISSMTWI